MLKFLIGTACVVVIAIGAWWLWDRVSLEADRAALDACNSARDELAAIEARAPNVQVDRDAPLAEQLATLLYATEADEIEARRLRSILADCV